MNTIYTFKEQYQPTSTHVNNTYKWWLTDITLKPTRSLYCFETIDNKPETLTPHIYNIDIYINKYNQMIKTNQLENKLETTNLITDEIDRYTYVKTKTVGQLFECIHVHNNINNNCKSNEPHSLYVHNIVDFNEYTLEQLNHIAQNCGYANMATLMADMNIPNIIKNNEIDYNDINWIQNAEFIAALITEQTEGRIIPTKQSQKITLNFIGMNTK